jgi:hypothetical protein
MRWCNQAPYQHKTRRIPYPRRASNYSPPPSLPLPTLKVDESEAEAAAANRSNQYQKALGDAIVAPPPSVVTDSKSNQQTGQEEKVGAAGAGGGGGVSILPGAEEPSGNKADAATDLEGQMVPGTQKANTGLSRKKLVIMALVMLLIIVLGLGIALGVTKCFGSCWVESKLLVPGGHVSLGLDAGLARWVFLLLERNEFI